MKTVVVIGGGITGLSTMFYLEKLKKDYNIDLNLILVEKEEYLGGKIHSVEEKDLLWNPEQILSLLVMNMSCRL